MQRGRVLNLSKNQIIYFFRNNILSLVCVLMLVLGVLFGIFFCGRLPVITSIFKQFFDGYISSRQSSSYFNIAVGSFLKSLILFLLVFIGGTTLFGAVCIPLFIGLDGFFYGSAVAYLYSSFALKGVAFNAVIFLPSNLLLIIFLIFAARYAMEFSLYLARLTFPNSLQGDLFLQFKEYSLKFLFLTLGSVLPALLDGLTATSMLRFFEF